MSGGVGGGRPRGPSLSRFGGKNSALSAVEGQVMYPEPKQRDLSETEKEQIRERIKKGHDDIYKLAREFGWRSSQIPGVKAALHR
jgi:hypothetical protein